MDIFKIIVHDGDTFLYTSQHVEIKTIADTMRYNVQLQVIKCDYEKKYWQK